MSLRFKLLLIALSTLALPWAGWQFVGQMEQLLREGQEQALTASARALVRSLIALKAPLPSSELALYVHTSKTPIVIDGYADEWTLLMPYAQDIGPTNDPQKLRIVLASYEGWLYVLAEIRDTTRIRADASDPHLKTCDHLTLLLKQGMEHQRYIIANAAPGTFEALTLDPIDYSNQLPSALSGQWQESTAGYRVEFRIPIRQSPLRFGLSVYDSIYATNYQNTLNDNEIVSYYLLHTYPQLTEHIAQFAPANTRVRLLSNEGWVVAKTGDLSNESDASVSRRRWLENWIYRGLIAPGLTSAQAFSSTLPQLNSPEIWQALSGIASTAWHPSEYQGQVVLAAVVPIVQQGEIRGALLMEQSSNALPLLTNRALWGLMGASLLAVVIASVILFLFAGALSLRIRSLRNAAERALRADGRVNANFPMTDARDELGDLSRSFAKLLDEVGAYTDYLRTMASKLSHELQTPLAIVKSSLDNLDQQAIPAAAQPYIVRARDGVERLGAIVRAMSEASRMERAIASAEGEDFDLHAVVRGCAEAYKTLLAPRELICELPTENLLMYGAPELIAQALDKLFDNAQSFTPADGWIRITLVATLEGAEIRVANCGPSLPATMQERLFDSLVSMREQSSTIRNRRETPHLGLGLYVVRMVIELHRGSVFAHNLEHNSGVEFCLTLQGMPRQRLVE